MHTYISVIKWQNSSNTKFDALPLDKRIEIITSACADLNNQITSNNIPLDKEIKGIITAPEYFLSRSNSSLSITRDTMLQYRQNLANTSRKYKDIVLIPGTMAYTKTINLSEEKGINRFKKMLSRMNEEQNPYILDPNKTNPLRNIHDGRLQQTEIDRYKKYWREQIIQGNSVEIYSNSLFIYYNGEIWKHRKSSGFYENQNNKDVVLSIDRKSENGLVNISDRLFGLEICFEHAMGVLKEKHNSLPLDFQIIVSDYVEGNRNNIHLSADGLLIGTPISITDKTTKITTIHDGIWSEDSNKNLNKIAPVKVEEWYDIFQVKTPAKKQGTMKKVTKESLQSAVIK
ncbi:hypothetical protein [Chromobacterium sphagni]|nr:hypothetical protein [Chromobacterium sphagni]